MESFGFMNAIVAVAKPVKKKKKLVSPKVNMSTNMIYCLFFKSVSSILHRFVELELS